MLAVLLDERRSSNALDDEHLDVAALALNIHGPALI